MFQKFQNLRQGNCTVHEYATEFFKMIEVRDTKEQLTMHFIGGLCQQIQFTLNLFQPHSISEAHQKAMTVEAQNKNGFQAWGTTRTTRQTVTAPPASSTEPATTKTETAIVPANTNQQPRTGGLRCYSCGETGHRMFACPSRNRRGLLLEEV